MGKRTVFSMYKNKTVSLILPTFNEKDSIKKVINDFENLGIIDEIIVVNNNASAGTSEEVRKTSAREVVEEFQGYGSSIMRGFREASCDLIAVYEPDDTFLAVDVYKLLTYSEDVDIVGIKMIMLIFIMRFKADKLFYNRTR